MQGLVKKLMAIWYFHRRLCLQSLLLTLVVSILGGFILNAFSPKLFAICYFLFAVFFHYYIYEVQHPGDYIFYRNLGILPNHLRLSTLVIPLLLEFFLSFIPWN